MELFFYIILFVFGMIFGSFGSVLVWRLRGKVDKTVVNSILVGHSECPNCKTRLGILDLIPVFSYIFSGGKCRYCGKNISIFYPMIEIITGLIFIFSYWIASVYLGGTDFAAYSFWITLIFIAFVNWILVLFIVQDFLFFELNVPIWIISAIIIIAVKFLGLFGDFYMSFLSCITLFCLFFGIYMFSKLYVKYRFGLENTEGFGGGDVMVAFWIGLLFDIVFKIHGIDFTALNLFMLSLDYLIISCFFGIIFAVLSYIFYGGKQGKSIPFLPAMIAAFWIIIIFGDKFMRIP